ncbi:LacI family DNA-binding transcriptional regulator [Isoptericola sp. NPDC057191]|uniref:LacI family DNA-binding transcriptional regulator n=1 Tax=Isoptericola sp. NPDC057191 TaxID=3346041 RepID=UPI00363F1922
MNDVARIAGVSAQTVSRVLSDHPHVNAATRAKVLAAVEESGYRRNRLARALVTGRSRTLGVVTHETDHYSTSAILLGAQTAARAGGYFVSTATTPSLSASALAHAVSRLLDQGVDGLLVAVPVREDVSLGDLTRGLPTVVLDGMRSAATEVVAVDQVEAGRLATEHLLELGHETVWHIAGPESWNDATARTAGWRRALEAAGRTVPPVLHGDWSPESGHRNGELVGRMPEVTALFVASDEMAFGAVRALVELGRRVPEDVSVVGMDDIALAAYASPPLTTVRQPFHDVGGRAVEHLLALLADPGTVHEPEVVRPELVVRSSTAPLSR